MSMRGHVLSSHSALQPVQVPFLVHLQLITQSSADIEISETTAKLSGVSKHVQEKRR